MEEQEVLKEEKEKDGDEDDDDDRGRAGGGARTRTRRRRGMIIHFVIVSAKMNNDNLFLGSDTKLVWRGGTLN